MLRSIAMNWTMPVKVSFQVPTKTFFVFHLNFRFQLQCLFVSHVPTDPRIPIDHKVILHFGDNNQTNDTRCLHFQSPMVKLEPINTVAKYNSLERFDDGKYILLDEYFIPQTWDYMLSSQRLPSFGR